MTKKSDSFIVTIDNEKEYHVIDQLEINKYAMKADIDPTTGSKQVVDEMFRIGHNILNPKYNPYYCNNDY